MVFVFANTLLDILNNQQPTHMAVVFDTPEPTHRHELYEDYKGTREEIPLLLSAFAREDYLTRERLREAVREMKRLMVEGIEARRH